MWNENPPGSSTYLGFDPVGDNINPFTGTFDGQGYVITNLFMDRTTFAGLFGYSKGIIMNLGLENVDVRGSGSVGGIAGRNLKTITDCYVTGTVSGTSAYIGGLVGYNYGATISNSMTDVTVHGTEYLGGLVGMNQAATVKNCYAMGDVTGDLFFVYQKVGGLVGHNFGFGHVIDSYAIGTVSGNDKIGGLVGDSTSNSEISNSFSTGDVSGNSNVGSLVGFNDMLSVVTNSFFTDSAHDNSLGTFEANGASAFYDISQHNVYHYNAPIWDFANIPIWDDVCNGVGFPSLIWEGRSIADCEIEPEMTGAVLMVIPIGSEVSDTQSGITISGQIMIE